MASKKTKSRSGRRSTVQPTMRQNVDLTEFTIEVDIGDSFLDPSKDFPGRIVKRDGVWGIVHQDGSIVLHGSFRDCILFKRRQLDHRLKSEEVRARGQYRS